MWHSSWRVWGKCSHRFLFTVLPAASKVLFRIDVTSGTHPPQPVPALVQDFTSPNVSKSFSWIALHSSPLVTLLQEQIWQSSSIASAPAASFLPKMSSPGGTVSCLPLLAREASVA